MGFIEFNEKLVSRLALSPTWGQGTKKSLDWTYR